MQEGGYLFVVRGPGLTGGSFRFDALELIADKKEYAPGETVKLIDQHGEARQHRLALRPRGRWSLSEAEARPDSWQERGIEEIKLGLGDMPNTFYRSADDRRRHCPHQPSGRYLPAAGVASARARSAPRRRSSSRAKLRKVKLKLTGPEGEPFAGTTIVTGYDKALNTSSGGSNVAGNARVLLGLDATHEPDSEDSLSEGAGGDYASEDDVMEPIGGRGLVFAGLGRMMNRTSISHSRRRAPTAAVAESNLLTGGLRFGDNAISNNAIDGLLSTAKGAKSFGSRGRWRQPWRVLGR